LWGFSSFGFFSLSKLPPLFVFRCLLFNPNLLTLRALDCLDCSWACCPSFFDVSVCLDFVFNAFLLILLSSQPYH
jgi:hypothetical protein